MLWSKHRSPGKARFTAQNERAANGWNQSKRLLLNKIHDSLPFRRGLQCVTMNAPAGHCVQKHGILLKRLLFRHYTGCAPTLVQTGHKKTKGNQPVPPKQKEGGRQPGLMVFKWCPWLSIKNRRVKTKQRSLVGQLGQNPHANHLLLTHTPPHDHEYTL